MVIEEYGKVQYEGLKENNEDENTDDDENEKRKRNTPLKKQE